MKKLPYSLIFAAALAVPAQAQSPGGTLAKFKVLAKSGSGIGTFRYRFRT